MYDIVTEYLPDQGLIHDYMNYTQGTEICPRFLLFGFLACLGSVIKRKIFFQRAKNSGIIVYPNPWIILVAPQGQGHKSSAIKTGSRFLEALEEYKPIILASKLTPEALIKSLASQIIPEKTPTEPGEAQRIKIYKRKAQGLLYSSEFGVLLGREKYNMGMIALLTDLYDCADEWNSETVMRGDQRLYEVCLSIAGASTPDWMQSMLPTDAFKGGFMSRLILVGMPDDWNVRIADIPDSDEPLKAKILLKLREIAQLKGEMKWGKDAKEFFNEWYIALPRAEPGPKAAYLERKQDHVLKLAMLLQIASGKEFELSLESIKAALNILEAIQPETLKMIEYISVEPRMRAVQRVLELLAKGPVKESDLLSEAWRYLTRPGEFDDIVNMLCRAKKIGSSINRGEITWFIIEEKPKEKGEKSGKN